MKTDRFLLFLLIGIGLLVVLAVGLFLARGGVQQAYGDESTPEGVLRNYFLAAQKQDFDRAYSYLSDTTKGKPTRAAFQSAMTEMQTSILQTGVEIGDTQAPGEDTVVITITLIHNSGGVFETPYRDIQTVALVREKGKWKIASMPYPYGDYSWFGGYTNKFEPAPVPEE
ncbi:protein containg lumazine-binding domain [Longilinea arvoryzae]|uniref:Protein containg lumazine-binding domain n=1 Tax=Longilinea arvoryzae TaxID=360412 RepID=A0A0S7BN79_9CHLR|nr:DUF4878 domain-containing protein [Longilinea arvoryzae]GAP15746.1 protein containg lumazine-binding domain [Longilinea arvoryzae]